MRLTHSPSRKLLAGPLSTVAKIIELATEGPPAISQPQDIDDHASIKNAAGKWVMRSKTYVFKRLRDDLAMLKLRHRRGHDLRRTMISLARTDGARKDILEPCTHTPRRGSAIDLYTTFPWEALCEEVSKLKVQRQSDHGEVLPLRALASGTADAAPPQNRALATAVSYRFPTADRKALDSKSQTSGGAGSRIPPGDVCFDRSRSVSLTGLVAEGDDAPFQTPVLIDDDAIRGRNVERPAAISVRLAMALARWTADGDAAALRRTLLAVLSQLG